MEKKYELNGWEYLSKQIFWYAIICFFEETFNPLNWTILNNLFMIVLFIFFQLYVLGTCLTEINQENGN